MSAPHFRVFSLLASKKVKFINWKKSSSFESKIVPLIRDDDDAEYSYSKKIAQLLRYEGKYLGSIMGSLVSVLSPIVISHPNISFSYGCFSLGSALMISAAYQGSRYREMLKWKRNFRQEYEPLMIERKIYLYPRVWDLCSKREQESFIPSSKEDILDVHEKDILRPW